MPKSVVNRREDPRYLLPDGLDAEIEFAAADGTRYALPLVEVGARGVAFAMPRKLPGVETGAMLSDAVITVGEIVVHGNLAVLHTTRGFRSDYICGAQLYPQSDDDRNEMVVLTSRLEKVAEVMKVPAAPRS